MSYDMSNPASWEPLSVAAQHIGMEMTHWGPDVAQMEIVLQEFHKNRHGIPHGGYYAMMLDTAMGYCGAFTGDPEDKKMTMTLSMNINYLSRPKGQHLIAVGKRIGGGAKTFFTEGTIVDETGELIATGQGTFRVRSGV
ncbi:PaaI family thioesterase [Celeribacter sp. ULVN23_4]